MSAGESINHAVPPYFGIDELIVLLWSEIWPPRSFDRRMREKLTGALNLIHPPGHFVMGIVGQVNTRKQIWCMMPQNAPDQEAVRVHFDSIPLVSAGDRETGEITQMHGSEYRIIFRNMKALKEPDERSQHEDATLPAPAGFIALVLKKIGEPKKAELDRFVLICYRALLPLFFDVFRHRENLMRPFAPGISELYWRAEVESGNPKSDLPRPPWYRAARPGKQQSLRYTITLSVDLRKSTLCMEQADDQRKYGEWLRELVKSMTEICHEYCGVFDKFTGDGGLMHFLNDECRKVEDCGKPAVIAAVLCAKKLRSRIAMMLPEMRENLFNDSELFGAGLSIASGEAFWDLDHRWNPIVVGRGVVDACRICDKTPPGRIRMSNRAYHLLRNEDKEETMPFHKILIGGNKEHSDAAKLIGWELREGNAPPVPPSE